MNFSQRITRSARENARLSRFFPSKVQTVDHFFYGGQSNMLGQPDVFSNPVSIAPGMAFSTREDQAWEQPNVDFTGRTTGYSTDRFGARSPAFGMAAEWSTFTGRRAFHTMLSWSGSPLLKETIVTNELNWEVTDDQIAVSLLRSTNQVYLANRNRANDIPHAERVRRAYSGRFALGRKYFIWSQGEAEGQVFGTRPGVTAANYTAAMQRMWNWLKANHGFNYMGILGLGRRGVDTTEVAANEPGHSAIRQAQVDFANANSDVFMLFTGAHQLGSPFNTFTVDGNGLWTGGAEYADGVHWTGEFSNAMGRFAARRLAQFTL